MAKKLSEEVARFFHNQAYVVVSTITTEGVPYNACKGIVEINKNGRVYLIDLYQGNTYANLVQNSNMSITAIDEHKFKGYCLSGKAGIAALDELEPRLIRAWENRITSRITQRVLKNIAGEKGHPRHPEALLPGPKYMIVLEVERIVDLTPHHLKQEAQDNG